jgi:hypothetical protein
VLCDFARQGHQVIMFTCHEHITDIFEDAHADVRDLPPRDGSEPAGRRRKAVEELPPPTPSVVPEEPEPVRIKPEADPNAFFQIAAAEEPEFDPVHPLPCQVEKPKRERKKKLRPQLPDEWADADLTALSEAWRKRFRDLPEAAQKRALEPDLPDSWPLADPPAAPPRGSAPAIPDTFELFAFRAGPVADEPIAAPPSPSPQTYPQPSTIILSPADSTPPAPKRLTTRRERLRFAWESPEMYQEERE